MDAMLGRLLAAIDRLNLSDNTWTIFMSENGWLLGGHRLTSMVLAYTNSVRVPWFIAGPGVKPRVEDRLAQNLDLAPTLLELAGVTAPTSARSLRTVRLRRRPRGSDLSHRASRGRSGSRMTLALDQRPRRRAFAPARLIHFEHRRTRSRSVSAMNLQPCDVPGAAAGSSELKIRAPSRPLRGVESHGTIVYPINDY